MTEKERGLRLDKLLREGFCEEKAFELKSMMIEGISHAKLRKRTLDRRRP